MGDRSSRGNSETVKEVPANHSNDANEESPIRVIRVIRGPQLLPAHSFHKL